MWVKKVIVSHQRNDCIGCGSCALIAPWQRSMDPNDGLACLHNAKRKGKDFMLAPVDEDVIDLNEQAAQACPMNIIQIHKHS